jgi:cullin-4
MFDHVVASVRQLLERREDQTLAMVYENIYQACRAVVCIAGKGEGLYARLKSELEQCVKRTANYLIAEKTMGLTWLKGFVEACDWFLSHVVSRSSVTCGPYTITLDSSHPMPCRLPERDQVLIVVFKLLNI